MLVMRIEDGGSVTGEGTAMFSIELSKFYTYRVAQHAEYRLAGSKPKHDDPAAADMASASHANSIA